MSLTQLRSNLRRVPEKNELESLINDFADIFSEKLPVNMQHSIVDEPGNTIPLAPGSKPTFRKPFRMSPAELEELRRQVAEFLAQGLIEPSSSPFGAPVFFIKKKTGDLRCCIDYRLLNKITTRNRNPLPNIQEVLDKAAGAQYFSALDMTSGYYQIGLSPEDIPKTAFSTPPLPGIPGTH